MGEQTPPLPYPFTSDEPLELSPLYVGLRAGPLCRVRLPYGEDAWLVTRYADARAVLSSPQFSLAAGTGRDQPRMRPYSFSGTGLLSTEGPDHSRLRGVVARHFSARRIDQMRVRMQEVTQELVDRLQESGPPGDLVQDFASPLSRIMIFDLLGVPEKGRDRVQKCLDAVLGYNVSAEDFTAQAESYLTYLTDVVELRRQKPREDLLTCLLQAREEGRLTQDELFELTSELLIGGFSTIYHQISNFLYLLLRRPEWLQRLREHTSDIAGAVEEMLRYVPLPNGLIFPRYATQDIEVGGALVRAGEPVLVDMSAANRDPAVFSDAETLLLEREPEAPHLSFGYGAHLCVGRQLARLELQIALRTLLGHMPGLKLAVPDSGMRWKTEAILKGPHELPVHW
ncbi:cytochrome P450 [Streptomyces sp. NPDC127117]|uniref:cytochrome P450 n=1 Tax=Streptomyces sp. NPDC127117 TaxID=3345368 RepID=UPI00362BFF61